MNKQPFSSLRKLRFSKQGIVEDLPRLIAITAGILVFLIVLMPPLWSMIKKGGETGKCDWNLLLSAGFKAGTLGFGEIPVGCQAEYTTADASTIQKTTKTAKKRIEKYCGEPARVGAAILAGRATSTTSLFYADAAAEFCETGKPTYDDMNEWAMDSIVGKKIVECWNKVWHGKLDFFTNYWVGERIFCVACGVVRFSDDLPAYIKNKQITSLYEWMNAERYYKTTYYDFVKDGQTAQLNKARLYYATDTPLAISFIHTKASTLKKAGKSVVVLAAPMAPDVIDTADVKQLVLMPYEGLKTICTDIIA